MAFAAIKGSSLDRPTPKRNAYEMVKAGESPPAGIDLIGPRPARLTPGFCRSYLTGRGVESR